MPNCPPPTTQQQNNTACWQREKFISTEYTRKGDIHTRKGDIHTKKGHTREKVDLPTSRASKAELGAKKYTRCKRKLNAKYLVGERKLDLFPLQETASSDVILAGIFQGFACQVGGVFQTCCLSTSVRKMNFFL